jgi:hypothetical protein
MGIDRIVEREPLGYGHGADAGSDLPAPASLMTGMP